MKSFTSLFNRSFYPAVPFFGTKPGNVLDLPLKLNLHFNALTKVIFVNKKTHTMMKLLMRLFLSLFITITFFSSCKKSVPKQVNFIPKEAIFVATLNTKSLQDKLVKSQVTIEKLIASMNDANDTALDKGKKEWEELKNSGIDLDENIYLSVVQKNGEGMGQETTVSTAVGGLKDATKFEAYIKKKDPAVAIKTVSYTHLTLPTKRIV